MRWLPLALLAGAACSPQGFEGNDGRIYFTDNLDRTYESYAPARPIAVGSHVIFFAASQAPPPGLGTTRVDPRADPTVGTGGLTTADAGTDLWQGWATDAGTTPFSWSGALSDSFSVRTERAERFEVSDPLLFYKDDFSVEHDGGYYADVGQSFALAPGSHLYLELVPRDALGEALSFETGWAWLDGGALYDAGIGGHGVNLVAPLVGPASDTFTVYAGDSGVATTFTLFTPADPVADVTRLELDQARVANTFFVVKATAWLSDGGVLWEPPVEWRLPEGVVDLYDAGNLFTSVPVRRDVHVLFAGFDDKTVGVSLGALDASVVLHFPPAPPPPAAGPVLGPAAPQPLGCAGCSAGGGTFALAALLWLLRRRVS